MESKVWMVVGRLRKRQSEEKPMKRIVYIVLDEFPTNEEARAGLLNNWSDKPHDVEIMSVAPMMVGGEGSNEQLEVIFNQPRPDAERILDYLAEHRSALQDGVNHLPPLPPDLEATVDRRISAKTWEQTSRDTISRMTSD